MTSRELLERGVKLLDQSLTAEQIDQLERYFRELQKWNRSINLVATGPDEKLIETHYLDSLTLLPLLDPCPEPGLFDVGSGGGFPGLVLKIARPDLPVTLVEPRQKRTAFLRQVIRLLGLREIRVREARLEAASPDFADLRGIVPLFVSRAFASIGDFLELCDPFSGPTGRVICMKGRKAKEQLEDWRRQHPESRYLLTTTLETVLPFSGTPRKLLVFTRNSA